MSMVRPAILPAALLAVSLTPLAPAPARADEVTGVLLAHDRKAHRVVLESREVYEYDPETTALPDQLLAGARIRIDYRGTEDGIEAITAIEVIEPGAEGDNG